MDDGVGSGISVQVVDENGQVEEHTGSLEPSAPHTGDSSLTIPGVDTGSSLQTGTGSAHYDVSTPTTDEFTTRVHVVPVDLPTDGGSTVIDVGLDDGGHVQVDIDGTDATLTYTESDGTTHVSSPIPVTEGTPIDIGISYDATNDEVSLIVDTEGGSPTVETVSVPDLNPGVSIDDVTFGGDTNDGHFEVDNFVAVDGTLTGTEFEADAGSYGGTDTDHNVMLENTFDDLDSSAPPTSPQNPPTMTQYDEDGNSETVPGTSTITAPVIIASTMPGQEDGGMVRVTEGSVDFSDDTGDLLGGSVDQVTVSVDVQVSLPGTTSGDSNTIISTETNVGVITVVEEDGSVHAEVTIGGVTSTTDSLPLPEDGAPVSVGFSLDTTTSELVVSVQPADGSPIVYSDPVTGVNTGALIVKCVHYTLCILF